MRTKVYAKLGELSLKQIGELLKDGFSIYRVNGMTAKRQCIIDDKTVFINTANYFFEVFKEITAECGEPGGKTLYEVQLKELQYEIKKIVGHVAFKSSWIEIIND